MPRVIFVGIHNKENMTALDSRTKTGSLVDIIIARLKGSGWTTVKTNLFDVDYLPKDDSEKFQLKTKWLNTTDPHMNDVMVLFGAVVQKEMFSTVGALCKKMICVAHPANIFGKTKQLAYVNYIIEQIKAAK